MSCWYCHFGWPKPVADIYTEALRRLGGTEYPLLAGPSHIVWEDENFWAAQMCLDKFDENADDCTPDELAIVRWSLEELAKLPADVVDIAPEDYDPDFPELYAPTVEVVKVR